MARISFCLLVLLLSVGTAHAGTDQRLTVKDLKVEFVTDTKVRVQGKLMVRGMNPSWIDGPWSEIAIHVDFPRGDAGFALLPDTFSGKGTEPKYRERNRPCYRHRGRWYELGKTKKLFYRSTWMLGPAVLEQPLDDPKHAGRWIAFDKTLDFAAMRPEDRPEYRVVFEWTVHGTGCSQLPIGPPGSVFLNQYFFAVYGPFPWGEAPASDRPLVSRWIRPASFTKRGVKVEEPVEPVEPRTEATPSEEPKPEKRPKLKRPDKQPTHLEAFEASEALQVKLLAMPEVESAGVGLPPRRALIRVSYKTGLEPQALTVLVAAIALETGYAAPWIDTLEMMLDGDQGSSRVSIPWDALVKHSAGETTLEEFFKTWEVGGDPLAAPTGG